MKLFTDKTDVALSIGWIFIYLAYCEYFGDFGPLFYLIHTPPIIFVVPFVIFIAYRVYKKKISIAPLLVSVLICFHLTLLLGREITLRSTAKVISGATTPVRICSWNTAYFFQWGKDIGMQRLVEQKCDFILLQEIWQSEEQYEELLSDRNTYFPEYYFYNSGEFVIFAKKGFTVSTTKSDTSGFFSISTSVNGKKIDITSIHLWNPITDMPKKINGVFTIVPAKEARNLQKKELITHISKVKSEETVSIIVGDFNTLQNGSIIRQITKLQNHSYSFISTPIYKSKNTYSTQVPLIQIDFAYISTKYKEHASLNTICKPSASDHCLLIIDLVL